MLNHSSSCKNMDRTKVFAGISACCFSANTHVWWENNGTGGANNGIHTKKAPTICHRIRWRSSFIFCGRLMDLPKIHRIPCLEESIYKQVWFPEGNGSENLLEISRMSIAIKFWYCKHSERVQFSHFSEENVIETPCSIVSCPFPEEISMNPMNPV